MISLGAVQSFMAKTKEPMGEGVFCEVFHSANRKSAHHDSERALGATILFSQIYDIDIVRIAS